MRDRRFLSIMGFIGTSLIHFPEEPPSLFVAGVAIPIFLLEESCLHIFNFKILKFDDQILAWLLGDGVRQIG